MDIFERWKILKKLKEKMLESEEKILLNEFHAAYPQYWYISKRKERMYRTTSEYEGQTYSREVTFSSKGIFLTRDDALKYLPKCKEITEPEGGDDTSFNPRPTLLYTKWSYEIKCCDNVLSYIPKKKEMKYKPKKNN